MSSIHLLIIDDGETIKRAAGPFALHGYMVTPRADGEAGLASAIQAPPDVIVLDVSVPRLDVAHFVRTLRTRPETALIPVIFLCARSEVEEKIQGFQLGSDDFLEKPVDARELEVHVAVANKLRQKQEISLRPRVPDSADFSSVAILTAFRGTLDQIGLPSLLSLIDMERKTGLLVLVLQPDNEKARIFFHDGRVVRASYDKKDRPKNAELVFELLARAQGKFEFRNVNVEPRDEINSPTARLLLEGARLIDETRRPE